ILEGLLLSLSGTAAGILLARFGIDLIVKLVPPQYPRFSQTQLDLRVLSFTVLLSIVTCLLFSLLPALQASKPDLQATLEQGRRVAGLGGGRQRLRQLLVVLQISLAVMLVIAAGLMVKSFWRMRQVDPGFKAERVLSLSVSLPQTRYGDNQKVNNFYNQLLDRITALAGVEAAAIAYDQPLQANWVDGFSVVGRPADSSDSGSATFNPIS